MKKRERLSIISYILIITIIVCLFSDTVFEPTKVYAFDEKTGTVNVDAGSSLNVRNGIGTSGTTVIKKLTAGTTVTIIDQAKASDGQLWYKIIYGDITGYVSAAYITNIQDKIEYKEDANFEAYLTAQGFPESYKTGLRALHAKYPKWVFVADHLSYEWSTALTNQSVVGRSLITKNAISSWKSTDSMSYNWSKDTWNTFDGGSWCAASKELVAYYMDPRNFFDETHIWMFEKLSYQRDFQTQDKLENILKGTFMEAGKNLITNDETGQQVNYSDIIMIAAAKSGVSPFHLAASILVEMGNSGASGSISGTVAGYEGYYNYYNWKAYAANGNGAIVNGLIYAKGTDAKYLKPWNTRYKSVVGGAIMLGESYINIGQDTLYYKKFDYVGTPYTHQYMTHIRAPEIESSKTAQAYSKDVKENTSIVFKIPVYKNMPQTISPLPTKDGSPNDCLSSLSINEAGLTPTFDKFTTKYSVVVKNEISSITVNAKAISSSAKIKGASTYQLKEGANTIVVNVTAGNGSVRNYEITIVREKAAEKPTETGTNASSTQSEPTSANGGTQATTKPVTQPTTAPSQASTQSTTQPATQTTTKPTATTIKPTTPPTTKPVAVNTSLSRDESKKIISNINPGDTVEKIKSLISISEGSVEVHDSMSKLKTTGKMCTGDKIVIKNSSGKIIYSYTVVIYGDVDGDGIIGVIDFVLVKKHLVKKTPLVNEYLIAGNVDKDNLGITVVDFVEIKKHLVKKIVIDQK